MIRPILLVCVLMALACPGEGQETKKKASPVPGTMNTKGEYELSKDELALDCKKLTGRMQVRILQIRDNLEKKRTSTVSQIAQQAVTPIFGGPRHGADPDADDRRDRAMLEAYNRQLAAKKCRTFDLEAELKPQSEPRLPQPVAPKGN